MSVKFDCEQKTIILLFGKKQTPVLKKPLHGKMAMLCIWWCKKGEIHFKSVKNKNVISILIL